MNTTLKTIKDEIKAQATQLRATKDAIRKTGKVIGLANAELRILTARTYTCEIPHGGAEMRAGQSKVHDAVRALAGLQFTHATDRLDNRYLQLVYASLRNVPYSCVEVPSYENRIVGGMYGSSMNRLMKVAQLYDPSTTKQEMETWLKGGSGREKLVEVPSNFAVI